MDSRVGARHFIPKFMEHLGVTPLHFILENLFYSYKMVSGTNPPFGSIDIFCASRNCLGLRKATIHNLSAEGMGWILSHRNEWFIHKKYLTTARGCHQISSSHHSSVPYAGWASKLLPWMVVLAPGAQLKELRVQKETYAENRNSKNWNGFWRLLAITDALFRWFVASRKRYVDICQCCFISVRSFIVTEYVYM